MASRGVKLLAAALGLLLGKQAVTAADALPTTCVECVKGGNTYDTTTNTCAARTTLLVPATTITNFRRCPDYARAASLLNCLDCLREGNQFVVGVNGTKQNTCVVTASATLDPNQLGQGGAKVLSMGGQCIHYNLTTDKEVLLPSITTCLECTLDGKQWFMDATSQAGGVCVDSGDQSNGTSILGVAFSPLQCDAGSCAQCLGGQWCYLGNQVNTSTAICMDPSANCSSAGLSVLPALQAQQLSPKCRPKATLRSEHNTCQYCLALRGTKWCDGQLTVDKDSYCYYPGDYLHNCSLANNLAVASNATCPAPVSSSQPQAGTGFSFCWDTKEYRCIMVGYVLPAALGLLVILLALLAGCACGACGKKQNVTLYMERKSPGNSKSPVVQGKAKDTVDDAFRRAELSDV